MNYQSAVDDDGADIGSACAVDEKVRAVKRLEMWPLLVDEDQVGGSAGHKLPMTGTESYHVSAAAGG